MDRDTSHLQMFLDRIDASVEKLTEISADVTQLLAVHENRITTTERSHAALEAKIEKRNDIVDEKLARVYGKLDELKTGFRDDLSDVKVEILTEIESSKRKITTLERWMWICLGGGGVVLFLADNIGKIASAIN